MTAAALVASPVVATAAEKFPSKEVKLLVNYGAGGAVDRTARSMQRFLPDVLGAQVIVENHGGAGGKIGLKKFLGEPRDGYTVLTAFAPAVTSVRVKDPGLFKIEDLIIINVQWVDPAILYVHKDTGWKTLDDMIKAVKAAPDKYAMAVPGRGSIGEVLTVELFKALGLKVKMVPYKSGGAARAALLGGHAQILASGAEGAVAARDKVNVLGAFWKDGKIAGWPELPTINAQLKKYGVTAPEGGAYRFHAVHREVKEKYPERFAKLVEAFKKATEGKPFREFAAKTKVGDDWLGPEKSTALIREVDARFAKILSKSK